MKTRLHLKALVLTLGLSCLPAVQAEIPTIEATSVIYKPIMYMQLAEQTLNTIQQIENQIMMYANQIKQIEQAAQNLKGSLDFKDVQSISDLQGRISRLKNSYKGLINAYNTVAKATNTYISFACEWGKDYVKCSEEKSKLDEALKASIESMIAQEQDAIKDAFETNERSTAKEIDVIAEQVNEKFDEKTTGTNQILINNGKMQQETDKKIITEAKNNGNKLERLKNDTRMLVQEATKHNAEDERVQNLRRQPQNYKNKKEEGLY